MAVAEEAGVEADVVLYMKTPPDRETLEHLVSILEDPVEDLVRKDSQFKKLGLDDASTTPLSAERPLSKLLP